MAKNNRISFNTTDEQDAMLVAIQKRLGFPSKTMTLSEAISFRYFKLFPIYASPLAKDVDPNDPDEQAKERARGQIRREDAKESVKEEEKAKICRALGGTITEEGGNKICEWTNYVKPVGATIVMKNKQKSLLATLGKELLSGQYFPDKKSVEDILAKEV